MRQTHRNWQVVFRIASSELSTKFDRSPSV